MGESNSSTPDRRHVRVVLAVAVVLIALWGSLELAGLSVTSGSGKTNINEYPECDGTTLFAADVRLAITFDTSNRDYPRLTSGLTLTMPASSEIARDIASDRDGVRYKQAVQCLLGISDGDWLPESRSTNPVVTSDQAQVTFNDYSWVDMSGPLDFNAGFLSGTRIDEEQWRIHLSPPPPLVNARWREIVVTAPPGWLSTPLPWPPQSISSNKIVWTPAQSLQSPAIVFFAKRDPAITAELSSGILPGSVVSAALKWIANALVPLIGFVVLFWMYRRQGQSTRTDERASILLYIGLAPVILVCSAWTLAIVQGSFAAPAVPSDWGLVYWWFDGLLLLAAVLAAHLWRLNIYAIFACALVAILALGASSEQGYLTVFGDPLADETAAYSAFIFAVMLLVLAGALNALDSMYECVHLSQMGAWLVASLLAGLLIVERVTINLAYYYRHEWADINRTGGGYLLSDLLYYPFDFTTIISSTTVILLVLCVWQLAQLQASHGALNPTHVKAYAIVLLVVGVMYWNVYALGYMWPIWILLTALVWLWISRLKYLPGKSDTGESLRDLVGSKSIETLRSDAAVWMLEHQERLALEQALNSGNGIIGFENWAARVRPEGAPTPSRGPAGRFYTRLRNLFITQYSPIPWRDQSDVTPLDLLLAVGPSESPVKNARIGIRWMAIIGIAPAISLAVLSLMMQPFEIPSSGVYPTLTTLDIAAWEVTAFLMGAAVLGMLWQYLPGRRGVIKALPIGFFFVASSIVRYVVPVAVGNLATSFYIVETIVFTAALLAVAMMMDYKCLQGPGKLWLRRRRPFLAAYGMQNAAGKAAFILAQIGALIAVYNFIKNGGEAPSAPRPDPSILDRGGSSGSSR